MAGQDAGRVLTAGVVGCGMAGRDFRGPLLREAGGLVTGVVTISPDAPSCVP